MPRARREFTVNFYGGEPLLAFDLIRGAVAQARGLARDLNRRPQFALTTNGSLLSEEVLAFLQGNRFVVVLSYDGVSQDVQRAAGSAEFLRERIGRILKGGRIRLEVNAVFTPSSVSTLSATVFDLIGLGVPRIRYSFSALESWNEGARKRLKSELGKIGAWANNSYRKGESCPLVNLREDLRERICSCSAAQDRLAVDVEGKVWGCPLFSDYAWHTAETTVSKRFCFGSIRRLASDPDRIYERIYPNYQRLGMDYLRSSSGPCFLCAQRGFCRICPITAAFAGGRLGRIPEELCRLQKTRIEAIPRESGMPYASGVWNP